MFHAGMVKFHAPLAIRHFRCKLRRRRKNRGDVPKPKTKVQKLCHCTLLISRNFRRAARACGSAAMSFCRACWTKAARRSPARTANIITPARSTSGFWNLRALIPRRLKKELGKGDGEILAWIEKNAKHKRSPEEIAAWSAFGRDSASPHDVESREYFNGLHKQVAPKREDIATWFDLLDVDDYRELRRQGVKFPLRMQNRRAEEPFRA